MIKKTLFIFLFVSLGIPSYAAVHNVQAKITKFRTHTDNHSTVSARQYTQIELGVAMQAPCSYLFLEPSDKVTFSSLLMAKAMNKQVKIVYDTAMLSPYSGNVCAAVAVDLVE